MDIKICTKCGIEKPLDQFYKDKSTKTGYAPRCKSCKDKHTRDYYNRNKDRINKQKRDSGYNKTERKKANDKRRRENNREKKLESDRRYREENRELIRERDKQYRLNNLEKYKEREKQYRLNNRELLRDQAKKYYHNNSKKLIERASKHRKEKGYGRIHDRASTLIKKLGIRPKTCPICGYEGKIVSHHPDYSKWNEIIFCCYRCHNNIHAGNIECPEPIDLLKLYSPG